jgi:hypothetical protein
VTDAEKHAAEVRGTAEKTLQQVEADVRLRQDELRGEVRVLEHRKREALERLREIAAALNDVLPGEQSLASDLRPQRAGSHDFAKPS